MKQRDIVILNKMVQYITEIEQTIKKMDLDFDKFNDDFIARNAITMCLLQIGELANHLTDDFRDTHTEMPWRAIIGMRNRAADTYWNMDKEIIWNTASSRMEELKSFCLELLNNQ